MSDTFKFSCADGVAREVSAQDVINAQRVADWSPLSNLSLEARIANAQAYGENWACILSGLGDQ